MALFLYNLFTKLYFAGLKTAVFFHPKARLFSEGRRGLFQKIREALAVEQRRIIWMHCASLGEFEQGRPLLKAMRAEMPEYALVLTFFSPSGYEIRKHTSDADYVFYLPTDSAVHARRFLDLLNPAMALFVKYEFWYHYLRTLHYRRIPVMLFSAFFQENQLFFKWYGAFYRRMLSFYRQIFVQDNASCALLAGIGQHHVQIAGDTRIDQSLFVRNHCTPLPAIATFKDRAPLLIAGSTWQKDIDFLKAALEDLNEWKVVIAPHETDPATVNYIREVFQDALLWTEDQDDGLQGGGRVLILNTIGVLNQAYQYADAVWIGGGFSRGIHNIIEPAVFGVPVFFGPNYHRFREADALIRAGGARAIHAAESFRQALRDPERLNRMGRSATAYVQHEAGATRMIMDYLFKWRSTTQ